MKLLQAFLMQRNRKRPACAAVCVLLSISVAHVKAQDSGEQVFAARCSGCHGLDGRGGEHAPDIATEKAVQALSDGQILEIVRHGKAARGMPAFGSLLDEAQMKLLIVYIRALQGRHGEANLRGNVENGLALFFGKGKCGDCHMIDGKGGFIANDLTGFGNGHKAAEIREAIVHPDQARNERSGITVVRTQAGQVYEGLTRNEDNFSLQLQAVNGTFYLFDTAEIQHVEHTTRSLMPTDYRSKLTNSELDDLVSYVARNPGRTVRK